jgi:transcriptional regulator GlxA family with amidase domain
MTAKPLIQEAYSCLPKIRKIGIFAFSGVEILDIGGPMEVFTFANLFLQTQGIVKEPAYVIEVLAEQPGAVTTLSGLQIIANHAYQDASSDIDTLIIPGGNIAAYPFYKDAKLMAWTRTMSTRVRRMVSICTGSFALAESGLLNGLRATTHWDFCQQFILDYPQVNLEPDQIFVRDGQVFTSGGITSGIDLALALLEDDWGHEVALFVARYMVVFLKRPGGQSQFSNYLTTEAATRPDLRNLQSWIMQNLTQDLRVEVLAERMCMSSRNFARLFLAETSVTPAKYVEMARIDAARHYLETSTFSIDEIAQKTGFSEAERMRRAFLRELGVNPKNYRDRFNFHFLNAEIDKKTTLNENIQRGVTYQHVEITQASVVLSD